MIDIFVVQHEMGHTQYEIQYKDLPLVYRHGANPAGIDYLVYFAIT